MLWICYNCPPVMDKICHFDELLLKEEGSGILNWAIEGACKLIRNGGNIPRSEAHLKRIEDLLMESDSVRAFITTAFELEENGKVLSNQLYSAYKQFCDERDWEPLPERKAMRQMKQQIESTFHIEQRHDLPNNYGMSLRGYTGIQFKD